MTDIGNRIKAALDKAGLSQRQLAASLNTTEATISQYVRGKRIPKTTMLEKIAKACNVPVSQLIDASMEPPKKEHIEFIVDYIIDGDDYQYSDNHGILTRCKDCSYFMQHTDDFCWCKSPVMRKVQPTDYCSMAVRREKE